MQESRIVINKNEVLKETKELMQNMCLDSTDSESANFKTTYNLVLKQHELEAENEQLNKSISDLQNCKKNQQQITENIDAIVWRFDLINDKWLYVSPQTKQILGYEPQEWIDLQWWISIMHPEDQQWAPNFCSEQTKEAKPHEFEYRLIHKNGTVIWIYDKVGVEMVDNKPVALYGVMFDVSKQKEIALKAEERELRLQSLVRILQFETSSLKELLDYTLEEAILLTQSKLGYIYFYNDEQQEFTLYAWSKEVMDECKIIEKQTTYKLEAAGIGGEAVRQRKPIVVNNFEAFPALKKGTPEGHVKLKNFLTIPVIVHSKIVAVIAVANKDTDFNDSDILDLTLLMDSTWKIVQKLKVEDLIKIQNAELLEANTNMSRLMTILSHDLKNPFNIILGYLQLLQNNAHRYTRDKIAKQVGIISESAFGYYELLEQLLTWIQTRSNKTIFNPIVLNLEQLCQSVTHSLKHSFDNKNIKVDFDIDKEMNVFADQLMLRSILRNLLSNAIKFTHTNGSVSIKAEKRDAFIWISVSDTGIGMDKELANTLLISSSVRSSLGTNKEKGTGLGLAICKEFVEKHGGQLLVESELKKGTIISFSLIANEKK